MTTLTAEPDRIDLDHATGACIVRLREERDAAVAALRDRDATIARLTAAVEASDAAVREYLAAEDAISASCDARDSATTTADADAAMSGSRSRIDRYHAARAALVAIDGGDHA